MYGVCMKLIKEVIKKFFPTIFFALRNLKNDIALQKPASRTSLGFKFSGNSAMVANTFEPGETKVFLSLLPAVDVVINVGANIGYYCCIALSYNKEVVAFEPIPMNVKGLLNNIKSNNWEEKIEVFPMAVGNKPQVLEIFGAGTDASLIDGWAGGHAQDKTLVPCSTLDLVLGQRFADKKCLLMIDIEGAEKMLLEGAEFFLNMAPRPIWLIEISVRAHQPDGVQINPNLLSTFDYFWSRGYEVWTTHMSNRKVSREEVEAIISGGEDTLFGDTFLFVHPETHGEYVSL